MTEYLITTIDPEGYCQPRPIAPDWPHVGQLLAQGWKMVALWDLEYDESIILLVRENETQNQSHDS
jgi:hypothetical protein